MKGIVITPKSSTEFKFISELLKKMGVSSKTLTTSQLEDLGLGQLISEADTSKKATKKSIMSKLAK